MYWILFVMATLVSVVIAMVVGGLATPRRHTASRTILLPKTPAAKVWETVRNVSAYPDWRDDIQSIEFASDSSELAWTEYSRQGAVSYRATVDEPPSRFTALITDDDLPYSGEWQYSLSSVGEGTRVVITEQGEVGNPIFRFFGAHILGYTRTIDAYLRDLAVQLNEQARPEPVSS